MAKDELSKVIAAANVRFSKGSKDTKPIISFGKDIREQLTPTFLSSGVPELDKIIGGGLVECCVNTLWGASGSGKSSLALQAVVQIQKRGGTAVWINAEPPFPLETALLLGVDVDELIIIDAKDYAEQIFDVIRELLFDSTNRVTRKIIDLIVIDSVNGLIPFAKVKSIDEKGSEGNTMGRRAAMLSNFFEELSGRNFLREKVTMITIAQSRVDINAYGAPEKMCGGKALEFLSKVIIKFKKSRIEGVSKHEGHLVTWEIEKNNVTSFKGEGEYQITYGIGINDALEVIEKAQTAGLIVKVKGKIYNIYTKDGVVTVEDGIGSARNLIKADVNLKNALKIAVEEGYKPLLGDTQNDTKEVQASSEQENEND